MRLVMVGLVLVMGLGACTGSGGFCSRAEELASRLESDKFEARDQEDVRDFAADMRDLADEAPDAIREETERVADGLSRLTGGDVSVADDEQFFRAVERFAGYVDAECRS